MEFVPGFLRTARARPWAWIDAMISVFSGGGKSSTRREN
jgi:hypothetical protein